ncbi:MAG TPA: transketolase, partial [Cytophagales bacterium]|nr:transketolase [Cytophagales bacterium]
GHAMGAGAALAAKWFRAKFGAWIDHTVYAYISDGGIQEEISQGIGRIAGFLGLSNLVMFFDSNDVQLSTYTDAVTQEDTAKKYEAWGWQVMTIDGHDHEAIRMALQSAKDEQERPTLIIGKTIMGKGCVDAEGKIYEGYPELHGKPIGATGADFAKTLEALGSSLEAPFAVAEDVKAHYEDIKLRKRSEVAQHRAVEEQWRAENAEAAEKLDRFMDHELPELDWSEVAFKENGATREASSAVLGYLAGKVENLIVASADLANSDKTDGFLKKTKAFAPGVFDANFLHAGVAEFSMAAMANGMALHGGVIPVIGTFFIFSDYQKPAIRLSALQELPVIYLWTHDAFRVGEDGPTHQPIEQEAQIRLMERVHNHKGQRSFLALRPADAAETAVAWDMALTNTDTPTGLIFSRQGIKDLPSTGSRMADAQQAEQGAYRVLSHPDAQVTLIASGSEVATCVEAAGLLADEGVQANVVSMISGPRFEGRGMEEKVLGTQPRFGLTAGLEITLQPYVGDTGKVFGLNHFGYSAPAKVLDEKFGFTGAQVAEEVKSFLNK